MLKVERIKDELKNFSDKERARSLMNFFKTDKGQYGEGDVFIGVVMPKQHHIAGRYYQEIKLNEIKQLLDSKIHEHRMTALLMLVLKFNHINDEGSREEIFNFYLKNIDKVNSWDLVDATCHKIVGSFLLNRNRSVLYKLAKSKNIWERRISIITTMAFIKNGQFKDTIEISKILLEDEEDLIHKAVGWMLREVGVRNQKVEEVFLNQFADRMPRTMLRYAIEKFEEKKRKKYLSIKKIK